MRHILAADIGATNSRFALIVEERGADGTLHLRMEREKWYEGARYLAFREILEDLRRPQGGEIFLERPPALAVLALAGPIEGETCVLSNLPWRVTRTDVREALELEAVHLLNDFAAQGFAALMPEHSGMVSVLPGRAVPGAPLAVVGAGTGFGQALLLREGETAEASPSSSTGSFQPPRRVFLLPAEGGHCDFPFSGEEEEDFAIFARRETGRQRLIGDAIVSGSGLALLYAFFTGRNLPPKEVPPLAAEDPQTLEWFARFYGRGCRNYLLATLALGGLVIAGGMALRLPVLTHPAFREELCASAAHGELLRRVPVWHMQNPQAGLWGAALYGILRQDADCRVNIGAL